MTDMPPLWEHDGVPTPVWLENPLDPFRLPDCDPPLPPESGRHLAFVQAAQSILLAYDADPCAYTIERLGAAYRLLALRARLRELPAILLQAIAADPTALMMLPEGWAMRLTPVLREWGAPCKGSDLAETPVRYVRYHHWCVLKAVSDDLAAQYVTKGHLLPWSALNGLMHHLDFPLELHGEALRKDVVR
jgi:hypothetical protein